MDRKRDRGNSWVIFPVVHLSLPKIRTTQDTTHYADHILNWIRRETERPSGAFERENSMVHIKNNGLANVCRVWLQGFDQKMSEEPVMIKSQIFLWCLKSLIFSNSKGKTFPCIFFNIGNLFPFPHILILDLSWWLVKKWTVCVPLSIYGDSPFLSRACDTYKQIRLYSLWILDSSKLHLVRNVHPCSTEQRAPPFLPETMEFLPLRRESLWTSWHLWRCFIASAMDDAFISIRPKEVIFIVQLNKVKVRERK